MWFPLSFNFTRLIILRVYISRTSATVFIFVQASELRNSISHSRTTPLVHSRIFAPFREFQHSSDQVYSHCAFFPLQSHPAQYRQKKRDRDRCNRLTSQKLSSVLGTHASFLAIFVRKSSAAIIFFRAQFTIARCSSVQQGTRSAFCTVSTAEKF